LLESKRAPRFALFLRKFELIQSSLIWI
jgi:hypothetical protein